MSDENTTEVPQEPEGEAPKTPKRRRSSGPRRTFYEAPTPLELKQARDQRLHQTLLDHSKAIRDALVTWNLEKPLPVPVTVKTEFDGRQLAAYYAGKGHDVEYVVGLDKAHGDGDRLVFQPLDLDAIEEPSEGPPAEPEPTPAPAKKVTKRAAKKPVKRASK